LIPSRKSDQQERQPIVPLALLLPENPEQAAGLRRGRRLLLELRLRRRRRTLRLLGLRRTLLSRRRPFNRLQL